MTQMIFYIDIKPTHLSHNSYYDHKGVLMKTVDLLEIIKNRKELLGGSLSKYTNKSLIKNEDRGWKQHIEEKHKV